MAVYENSVISTQRRRTFPTIRSLCDRYGKEYQAKTTSRDTCWLSRAVKQEKAEEMDTNALVQKQNQNFLLKKKATQPLLS